MTVESGAHDSIFRHVFKQLGVPDAAADLVAVAQALRDPDFGFPIRLSLPLPQSDVPRRSAVQAAWTGLVGSIEPSPQAVDAYASTPMLRAPDVRDRFLKLRAPAAPLVTVEVVDDELGWLESSLWPIAFSGFLGQLVTIAHVHQLAIEQRRAALPFGEVLSEYPRLLPTRFHYAAASLGAWVGGAINVQFFSLFACGPQLSDAEVNRGYAADIGYVSDDAEALTRSGIVAIPAKLASPLLEAQESSEGAAVFGSLQIDEFNLANPPSKPSAASPIRPGGLILDSYYRTPFRARALDSCALYGERDVLRDHYTDFYDLLEVESLVRCKHYCAPVVAVSSLAEVHEVVGRIPQRSESGLRFRGQSRLYYLSREDSVKRLLFGSSTSLEPSLTTSASRGGHDYDRTHFLLKHFLSERIFARWEVTSDPGLMDRWRKACFSGACELDYALIAFAQHYGLPSHGLDVSRDIDIAVWFATHALSIGSDAAAEYRPREEVGWPARRELSPVVLVHQVVTHSVAASLQSCTLLEEFGLSARRPVRQAAEFFFGGHTDHRNRLAETLVCVLRLEEGDYRTGHAFDALFPRPEHDDGYRIMLDFAARAGSDDYPVLRFH
jgi:FRG domain-containing protein